MVAIQRICLIGFGEVGELLAEGLLNANDIDLIVFDTLFRDALSTPTQNSLKYKRVLTAASATEAVAGADIIISAVTAERSLEAVRSALPALKPDAWFLDLNSVSPAIKSRSSTLISRSGARYVEAAVMSPIQPAGINSQILMCGPNAEEFCSVAQAIGFSNSHFYSSDSGSVSALKMCRSVIVKGLETLLMESMLAARHYGVERDVLSSLQNVIPGANWPELTEYMISRSLRHGARRAEEMREAARTVTDAGIPAPMSTACAEGQQWAANLNSYNMLKSRLQVSCDSLLDTLDCLLASRQPEDHLNRSNMHDH